MEVVDNSQILRPSDLLLKPGPKTLSRKLSRTLAPGSNDLPQTLNKSLIPKSRVFNRQDVHAQLSSMRASIEEKVKLEWSGIPLKRIAALSEIAQSPRKKRRCTSKSTGSDSLEQNISLREDLTVAIIGCIFNTQSNKQSVLEELEEETQIITNANKENCVSGKDILMLEDEITRVRLIPSRGCGLSDNVNGVVCAVKGKQNPDGMFEVKDVIWATPNPSVLPVKKNLGSVQTNEKTKMNRAFNKNNASLIGTTKHRKRNKKMLVDNICDAIEQSKVCRTVQRKAIVDFMKEQNESVATPSGIIKKIKLYNFMCHDSFEREWHPNLNFITGENGSGKSSILNGIIVGLGARAAVTSRTKSIKSLVKVGKACAKTEITLENKGILSTEKYGNEFTIQRVIDFNGVSTYKIQAHGKLRQLRRIELDNLLLTLGIQLDNPVSILNQETARSFLKSKDPKDKYHLFYSGTLLNKCESVINDTNRDLEAANAHLKSQVKIMHSHKEELLKLENLMQLLLEVEELTNNLSKLEKEHAWSLVKVIDKTKSEIQEKLDKLDSNLAALKSSHAASLDERNRLTETTPEAVEKNEITNKIRSSNVELENLRRSIANTRKTMNDADATVRSTKSVIRAETKSIHDLEITIENLRSKGSDIAEKAKRELEAKMQEFDDEKSKLDQEIKTLKNDSDQFRHGAEACMSEMNELQEQDRELGRQLLRKKEDLELMKKSATNKYAPYGRQMQELVAKVQANASRFKKLPRGPLGACFTVKSEKWVCIIEHVLNQHLFNFVVDDCQSDKNLMLQLINQTYGDQRNSFGPRGIRRPDVNVKKFETEAIDISRGNASMKDHPTILDAIEIEDNDFITRNALIDYCKIERILLFEENTLAIRTLSGLERPDFPRTCVQGFSCDFYKITPAPKLRIDAISRFHIKKQAQYLKSTNSAQLKNLNLQIGNLQDQIKKMRPALEAKRKEERQFRTELDVRIQASRQVERKFQQVILRIEQAKRTAYKPPDISTFLEELDDKKSELAKTVQRQESAEHILENGKAKASELVAMKAKLDDNARTLHERLVELESESDNIQTKLKTLQNLISRMEKELKEVENKKKQIIISLKTAEEDLQRTTDAAKKISNSPIKTLREPETIKKELVSLKRKVEESKKQTVEKSKIKEDLKKARKIFHEEMSDLQIFYMLFTTVKNLSNANVEYFDKSRKEMGNLLSGVFLGLLGPRRYKGRLIIDHEKKELYYFVCADAEANASAIKVLKTNNNKLIKKHMADYSGGLSGGERSFATICFIIAMWQVMETPFFMLDEFDVFMDAFNRKSSQAALICHAQKHRSHQFFFFTPLDLSMQPDPALSTILRLFPPVRTGQSQSFVEDVVSEEDDESPGPSSRSMAKRPRRK